MSHLDLDGADLGPGHDVVEVVLVHEVVAGVAAAHHQRHRGLVILGKEKINKNPKNMSLFIYLGGTLAKEIAVERSGRVGDWVPIIISDREKIKHVNLKT